MIRALLPLLLASFAILSPAQPISSSADEVSDLAEAIKKSHDDADPADIKTLAGFATREAAQALTEIYGAMGSIYMRLEVLKTLPSFDGIPGADQLALQKLMDIATESEERELRDAALDAIGRCDQLGKPFLMMIVESPAEDDIRERAMDLHVDRATKDDHAWYRKIYKREKKAASGTSKKKRGKRGKKAEEEETPPELKVYKLATLREKAFAVVAKEFTDDELKEVLSDPYWGLRYLALEELRSRDLKKAVVRAEELYSNLEGRVELRALSARILAEDAGTRIADRFIKDGRKFMTPTQLRNALADILAEFEDDGVNKKTGKLVGKGKVFEKLFILRAVRKIDDDKLNKRIQKLLRDREADVRVAAAATLAERGDVTAVKELQKMIDKSKDPVVIAGGIDAMSEIRGTDEAWDAQLVEYASGAAEEVRNAAIMQIGKDGRTDHFDLFGPALKHPLWSTRHAAMRGLVSMRDKRALPLLIAQVQHEKGRMLYDFVDGLFELTGKPYRISVNSWRAWWENEGADFEVISLDELEKARAKEEERRLKQITNVKFFGIRIISHRVIFIIDVSGSMNEPMRVREAGGGADIRMEVAKRELSRCIEGLDSEALFNIITFSNGVESWLQGGITGADPKSREEAVSYISRLGAGGATNLYDSLRLAFDDPDADTIFILSDGEPTAGEELDISVIRNHVAAWNEHRKVVINTIGIGGSFEVLAWLAEDSGGTHVKFR
jgi:hypothetical protein